MKKYRYTLVYSPLSVNFKIQNPLNIKFFGNTLSFFIVCMCTCKGMDEKGLPMADLQLLILCLGLFSPEILNVHHHT